MKKDRMKGDALFAGLRFSHGEFVNWRKEKRRKRKLLLLNKKCRMIGKR